MIGKLFPSGNAKEFGLIDGQLDLLGVEFRIFSTQAGGRLYVISEGDESLLPNDEDESYMPCGYLAYPVDDILNDPILDLKEIIR